MNHLRTYYLPTLIIFSNLITAGFLCWRARHVNQSCQHKLNHDMMIWMHRFDQMEDLPYQSNDLVSKITAEYHLRLFLRSFVDWFREVEAWRPDLLRTPKGINIDDVILSKNGLRISSKCQTPFYGMFFMLAHKICQRWPVSMVTDILSEELSRSDPLKMPIWA